MYAFLLKVLVEFFEDTIHKSLEAGWGVGHAKEHDLWFKKSVACFECSFPFVTFSDTDVVIAPSDVKFAKYFHSL